MSIIPITQQSVQYRVNEAYPGDWTSDRGSVTLSAVSKIAVGDLPIGGGVFPMANPDTVTANSTTPTALNTQVVGFVLRNQAPAVMPGLSNFYQAVPDSQTSSIATAGSLATIATGVNATGTPDHSPAYGDLVWVNLTTGLVATAPSSITAVTGYALATGWVVTKQSFYNERVPVSAPTVLIEITKV